MVTTKCTTDCLYCYANRKLKPEMPTEKILSLIKEFRKQGTVNVSLTGGDVFAHPDWEKILECIRENDYSPYLSTKTPLSRSQIQTLLNLGFKEIQFSLDSVDKKILHDLIKVNEEYLKKVEDFFNTCSELNFNVLVRSVLTKKNATEEKIKDLYNFLSQFECIKEWDLTPAFFSKYKEKEYKNLEADNNELKWAYEFTQKEGLPFKTAINKITKDGYKLKRTSTIEDFVCQNQICIANTYGTSVLVDGNVSICEMLYDNHEYILGNVNHSSIKDIWNSEKALSLYNMSQENFPVESACKTCKVFDKCRNEFGKRVCYVDIFKSGKSKYFPDPRCPNAEDTNKIL